MKKTLLAILLVLFMAPAAFAVTLAWDDNPEWPNQGVVGIRIYFEDTSTGVVQFADIPYPNTQGTISDSYFKRGIPTDFWATAFNSTNESGPSNVITETLGWDGDWDPSNGGGTAPIPNAPNLRLSTLPGGYVVPAGGVNPAD